MVRRRSGQLLRFTKSRTKRFVHSTACLPSFSPEVLQPLNASVPNKTSEVIITITNTMNIPITTSITNIAITTIVQLEAKADIVQRTRLESSRHACRRSPPLLHVVSAVLYSMR